MSRTLGKWARLVGGLAILLVLGWRLGAGPFIAGARAIRPWSVSGAVSIAAALMITALTTACCAWRWRVVARGLGARISPRVAIAAYYRSQFLNTVLPGGVIGDVHRGVDQGRADGGVGRGLRAVAWERFAGQAVQLAIAVLVLAVLPSPARSALPFVLGAAAILVLLLAAAVTFAPRAGMSRAARALRVVASDVRHAVLPRDAWPALTFSSALVVAGHVAVFLIAAHAAGLGASALVLLPLALLALVAAAVPTNIGGWGPREGVAAWAFASAGLGADRGVATATAYGVLVLIASLPGAIVVLTGAQRRHPAPAPITRRVPDLVGARHG